VVAGRLVLDEPVELPDGTVVELMPAEEVDGLDEAERGRLHASLQRAAEQLGKGGGVALDEALRRIRGAEIA